MDIVIYCIKDAATDWLLWGGILFILLACIIRSLRGWKTSTKMAFSAIVPHVIICAGLVTLFSILTGLFESRLCMFICNVLDILDVLYIIYVSLWLVIDKELTMQGAVAILPTVLLDSDCISLEFFLTKFFKIDWCNNLKKKLIITKIRYLLGKIFTKLSLKFLANQISFTVDFLHVFCVIMALRPSGFVEYSPSEQRIFDQLISEIQNQFQLFGYTHIHTPAVESNTVLLSKNGEETGKQIFGLYGLAQGASDLKDYALHFDLTVPFARYVLDWEDKLTFPFKRFQIQPVRRGERAQKGRYREFWQCDIDVIWRRDDEKTVLYYDGETILTLMHALDAVLNKLEVNDEAVFHISNRKLIIGLLNDLVGEEKTPVVCSYIDKRKKIGAENFIASLVDAGIKKSDAERINEIISRIYTLKEIKEIDKLSKNKLFYEGLAELKSVLSFFETWENNTGEKLNYVIDLQIIRGLDYYSGTVFEAVLKSDEGLGSICGGGKYDHLTGYLNPKKDIYAGFGGSIGISRLLSKIFGEENEKSEQKTATEYLFLNFPETNGQILKLMNKLQKEGKNCELYYQTDKLGKQFGYADKKGIPYVVILGEGERSEGIYKIKNMQTGGEETVKL